MASKRRKPARSARSIDWFAQFHRGGNSRPAKLAPGLAGWRASQRKGDQVVVDRGNADTVVIPVKLGLPGLGVRLYRVPGPDLGWCEIERSPVGGDGSDKFSIPWLLGLP